MADFTLTSPSFAEGAPIPTRHSCDGSDLSPALEWRGAPSGTESLALILDDLDAQGFIHWVVIDIPGGSSGSLPEGIKPTDAPLQGRSDFVLSGYGGPCPPNSPTSSPHRSRFTIWALSTQLNLSGTPTADEVRAAMADHILAQATLTGTYTRK